MTRLSRPAATALAACGLVLLSACGTGTVEGDEVAKQVSSQLEKQVGQKPDKVDCPDLTAEKGKKVTCVITAGEDTIDAAVTVSKVDGNDVSFDIAVADQVN